MRTSSEVLDIIKEVERVLPLAKSHLEECNNRSIKEKNKIDRLSFVRLIQLKQAEKEMEKAKEIVLIEMMPELLGDDELLKDASFLVRVITSTFRYVLEADERDKVNVLIERCVVFPFEHDEEFIKMKKNNWKID